MRESLSTLSCCQAVTEQFAEATITQFINQLCKQQFIIMFSLWKYKLQMHVSKQVYFKKYALHLLIMSSDSKWMVNNQFNYFKSPFPIWYI